MNDLVFNNTANTLNTIFYGVYGTQVKPVAVDSSGMFIFSSTNPVTITATDLDIRNLNYTTDSVTVTATDLDIRNLNGAQDSIQIYNVSFTEDNVTQTVSAGTTSLLTKDISNYSENSYFLRNTGGATLSVILQIAPINDNNFYYNDSSTQSVTTLNNIVLPVTAVMKYARLAVIASTNTGVVVYYNGRA